tara:strand:- start:159 stop:893 length:735 start_codon:yes stop_codon:yes gene_type:complete
MFKAEDVCIIVPARAGSKGILHKNIKIINGKSLLQRTLESATSLVNTEDICLSTDSDDYYFHVRDLYNPVYLKRSNNLSGDKSLAINVWKNALEFLKNKNKQYSYSIYLEPTSPIRNTSWIREIFQKFRLSKDDLWMSIKETDSKYRLEKQFEIEENGAIKNAYQKNDIYSIRQNSKRTYHKDGVFYLARNQYIAHASNLLEGKIKGIINNFTSVNIDTYEDLDYAKFLIKKEENQPLIKKLEE